MADIIRAAPDLRYSPGTIMAIARSPGDHIELAHQVAGVAKAHAIHTAVHRVSRGVGPNSSAQRVEDYANQLVPAGGPYPAQPRPSGGFLGDITGGLGAVGRAIGGVPQAAERLATGGTPRQAAPSGAGGIAPGVTMPALQSGLQSQVGGDVRALAESVSPNQVMQTPSHIYRYLYDVRARHGNAAALEAAIPLIGGAVAGYALTHSASGGEELGSAAADALGAAKAPESGAAAATETLPTSAASGLRAQRATQAVLAPATATVRAGTQALSAVSTSPVALGGEGAISVSGHVLYPQSWQRTTNATTWKLPNGTIGPTFGQTVAGAVGLSHGSKLYNDLSGSVDAFMALAVPDPYAAAGRSYARATQGELGGYLGSRWTGTAPVTAEGVRAADTQYPRVRAAIDAMVGKPAGQIVSQFPQFAALAPKLANKDRAGVLGVFEDAARSQELLTTSEMPKLGLYGRARAQGARATTLGTSAPTAFDPEVQKFVGKVIPIGSSETGPAVYAMLRGSGEKQSVAQDVAAVVQGTSDPYIQYTAARNAMKLLVQRKIIAALPRGHDGLGAAMIQKVSDSIDEMMGGAGAGHEGEFTPAGSSAVYASPEEDKSYAAAIWMNQAGQMIVPSTHQIGQLVRDLALQETRTFKNSAFAHGLAWEQWLDHNINERIFQPLALATMGWATRVSISEAAMNVLRQGPLNFAAGRIATSAVKQNWKITHDEMPHFVAAVRGVLAGIDASAVHALGKERILDAATTSIKMFNGHVVHPGLDSTHIPIARGTDLPGISEADIAARNARIGVQSGRKIKGRPLDDTFSVLVPSDTGYFRSWSEYAGRIAHDQLGEQVARFYHDALDQGYDEAGATTQAIQQTKAYLDSLNPASISHMIRTRALTTSGRAMGLSPHEDWAIQAVGALKATVYGEDGTFHRALLNDIVDKQVPDVRGMLDTYQNFNKDALPRNMPGRRVRFSGADGLTTLTNKLHSHLLGPVVNALSREPTWVVDFANERKLLETKVRLGELDQTEADAIAAERAIHKSIRFVHNPLDRMKIENMLHVVSPFYFAQNQALRRMGRLFANNPGAFEQYVKAGLAVNNAATTITDKNGFPTVVIPGTTLGGEGITAALHSVGISPVAAIPIGLTGGVDVSNTVFPFSAAETDVTGPTAPLFSALKPSLGPVATIPLRSIEDFFSARAPRISATAAAILGPVANSTPFWTQAVPNSLIQHLIEGGIGWGTKGDSNAGSSYTTALLGVMASMAAQGDLPQANTLQGTTYPSNSAAKAAFIKKANNITAILWLGRTLTGFASPVSVSLGQAGLKFTDMAQNYINSHGGSVNKGLSAMTHDHPDLVPYEVFKSTATDGYAYPEVEKSAQWIKDNHDLVQKYGAAARWLLPNYDTKGKFSDSAYQYELALGLRAKLTPSEFFDQIYIQAGNAWYFDKLDPQVKAAIAQDPSQSYQIYAKADQIAATYGATTNPIWQDYWTGKESTNKRQQVEAQIETMLEDPATPHTPEAIHLANLVNLYRQFKALQASGQSTTSALKAQWGATMNAFTQRYPDTTGVVQTVFLGLG